MGQRHRCGLHLASLLWKGGRTTKSSFPLKGRNKMVKISGGLLKEAGAGINKTLSEILVCPLTKKPLRYCEKTESLISEDIGVSFPIVDGIPCLVPKDGKTLDESSIENSGDSSIAKDGNQGADHQACD